MSDQITINVVPDSFVTVTAEEGNENVYLNPITLNQGIINHSTTHASGGSDELLHNALGGLNGGTSGQFYHLTSQEYSNLVYTTGDQNISGLKNFYTRPQVNGIGVLLSGEGGGGSASGDYLPLSGGTINGFLNVTDSVDFDGGVNFNTFVSNDITLRGGNNTALSGDNSLSLTSNNIINLNAPSIYATGVVSAPIYNLSLHDASITSESSIKSWQMDSDIQQYLDIYISNNIRSIYFSDNGLFLYALAADSGSQIYVVELESPWTLNENAVVLLETKDTSSYINSPQGLYFSPDGTKMFLIGVNGTSRVLLKYNLGTPWEVSTSANAPDQTLILTSLTGMSGVTDPKNIYFKSDGSKFFVLNRGNTFAAAVVWEVSLLNNWDISSGSVNSTTVYNLGLINEISLPLTLSFTADGSKMIIWGRKIISGNTNSILAEFLLNIPWSAESSNVSLNIIKRSKNIISTNTDLTVIDLNSIYFNSVAGKAFFYNSSVYNSVLDFQYVEASVSTNNNLIINGSIYADYFNDIQSNSIRCLSIQSNGIGGIVSYGGPITVESSSLYVGSSFSRIYPDTNGIIRLSDASNNSFDKLRFGGTTNSFPSIKRNASGIDIVTADNTNALTTLRAGNTSFNNISGNACTLSGNLAVDTNVLFVDTNLNRVGVGTNSPLAALDVSAFYARAESTFNTTNGSIQFKNDPTSTRNASIQYNAGLGFYVNNYSQVLFIDDNIARRGNVGIGTTSPTEKLTVLGNISGSGSVIINNDFESINSTKGVILKAPNGSRFRITIDNSGALTTTAL